MLEIFFKEYFHCHPVTDGDVWQKQYRINTPETDYKTATSITNYRQYILQETELDAEAFREAANMFFKKKKDYKFKTIASSTGCRDADKLILMRAKKIYREYFNHLEGSENYYSPYLAD